MFWFDRDDDRAVFCDRRVARHKLPDISSSGGYREFTIRPNVQCDFTALPFPSNYFQSVVFDPPHFERNGASGWVNIKYGTLIGDWREMLTAGFAECFRVLVPSGTLIFKWCDVDVPLSEVLKLVQHRPLIGHRSGKQQGTHWVMFVKPSPTAS